MLAHAACHLRWSSRRPRSRSRKPAAKGDKANVTPSSAAARSSTTRSTRSRSRRSPRRSGPARSRRKIEDLPAARLQLHRAQARGRGGRRRARAARGRRVVPPPADESRGGSGTSSRRRGRRWVEEVVGPEDGQGRRPTVDDHAHLARVGPAGHVDQASRRAGRSGRARARRAARVWMGRDAGFTAAGLHARGVPRADSGEP